MDLWLEHRGHDSRDGIEDSLCGILFNAEGYLYEILNNNKNMKKGTPKRDGSGKGTRANKGRGGCKTPQKTGKGK